MFKVLLILSYASYGLAMFSGSFVIPRLQRELPVPTATIERVTDFGENCFFEAVGVDRNEFVQLVGTGTYHGHSISPYVDAERQRVEDEIADWLGNPDTQALLGEPGRLRHAFVLRHFQFAHRQPALITNGLLAAMAEHHGIEIVIYQRNHGENTAGIRFHYRPRLTQRTVYLLYTPGAPNALGETGHFDRLRLQTTISEETALEIAGLQIPQTLRLEQQRVQGMPSYLIPNPIQHPAVPTLTVVFDLDETLVNNRGSRLRIRPGALELLGALRQLGDVEIVLWTASDESTLSVVLRELRSHLPVNTLIFDHVIARNARWFPVQEGFSSVKDLRRLGRDMRRVLMVENSPFSCKFNRDNCILVSDYTDQVDDFQLANLISMLTWLNGVFRNDPQEANIAELLRVAAMGQGPLQKTQCFIGTKKVEFLMVRP